MKYAIISDIHANLEALLVCFKNIDDLEVDKIICLGDLVDYCAQPNECVELIQQKCNVVIRGNHDEAQFNYSLSDGFSENARISSIHTRSVIKKEYVEYLKTLPLTYREENLLFVHGSPSEPDGYRYVLNSDSAKENFDSFEEAVCFIGHSHLPAIFEFSKNRVCEISETEIMKSKRYIINVGSVGQPRDGNPNLSFGYFDSESFQYLNIRNEYDIKSAAKKIINEDLPARLADRLHAGL